MRLACLLVLALAVPAAADPAPKKTPAKTQPAKKPAPPAKKVVYQEITAPIVVTTSPAKPNVVYVSPGGKNVTGRPKSDDRLKGLGPGTK